MRRVLNTPDFNLEATLESGQVFGFEKKEDWYEGLIYDTPIRMRQREQVLEIQEGVIPASAKNRVGSVHKAIRTDPPAPCGGNAGIHKLDPSPKVFVGDPDLAPRLKHSGATENLIAHFFHLDFDLTPVYELLTEDPRLHTAVQKFKGLRIIRQNVWEALACFIISSNNNIKRIQKIRRNLTAVFSTSALGFPHVDQISKSSESKLRMLGLGYRAPFLLNTARMISENPKILDELQDNSYVEAKAKLLEFPGVGEKVADCVLLFGSQKYEAFPVDTWISKAMRKLYFRNRKTPERKIQNFGRNRWKQYAGYVQQYLFHAAKSGML